MYLIVSGKKTNNYFKKELCKLNIDIIGIPCVDFYPKTDVIYNLKKQINDFDIIIITSPMAIDYAGEVFKNICKNLIFIVPGFSSFLKLGQYTENKIFAPKHNSGAEAIIDEVLTIWI